MTVRVILDEMIAVRGVRSASVVGAEGTVVDGVAADGGDLQLLAERVASAVGSSRALAALMGEGGLQQAFLEYLHEPVLLAPVGPGDEDAVLVLTLGSAADLGRVRYELRRALPRLAEALVEQGTATAPRDTASEVPPG